MSPIPFCPSLEPCEKETNPQVSTSMDRIHQGGGASPSGEVKSVLLLANNFAIKLRSMIASKNPKRGEINKDKPTSPALSQFTAASPVPGSKL